MDAHPSDAVMQPPCADSIHHPLSRLQRLLEVLQRLIQGAEIIVAESHAPLHKSYSETVPRLPHQFEGALVNGDGRLVGARQPTTKSGPEKREALFVPV